MTIVITRTSATRYDVTVNGQPAGAGNTLRGAQRIAARHHRRLTWRRINGQWIGRPRTNKPDLTRRTHGIPATYNAGCRCQECRHANTTERARQRRNVLPPEKLSA